MKEIPLSQGYVALVDDEDFEWLMQWKWFAGFDGNCWYAKRSPKKGRDPEYITRRKFKNILMHRVIVSCPVDMIVDHINGDGLDNRRCNLRVCNYKQNGCNKRPRITSIYTSTYKGVSWHKASNKWRAQIHANGNSIWLGSFDTEEEAARAYNEAALKRHGNFANINVLPGTQLELMEDVG